MKTVWTLFKAEFKRFWTLGMIIFAVGLAGMSVLTLAVSVQAGTVKTLSSLFLSTNEFLSFFTFLIFSAGIVSADVKSGWVRTLLIRAVTREQYLVTKMLVNFSSTLIVYGFCLTIAVAIISFNPEMTLVFDLSRFAAAVLLMTAHIMLLIVLSSLVSCGISGSFNALFVYAWMLLGEGLGFLITQRYWDVQWAVILKDYLFPNGFTDALKSYQTLDVFPTTEILWGIASLTFFFALTLFAMNHVEVDGGSE